MIFRSFSFFIFSATIGLAKTHDASSALRKLPKRLPFITTAATGAGLVGSKFPHNSNTSELAMENGESGLKPVGSIRSAMSKSAILLSNKLLKTEKLETILPAHQAKARAVMDNYGVSFLLTNEQKNKFGYSILQLKPQFLAAEVAYRPSVDETQSEEKRNNDMKSNSRVGQMFTARTFASEEEYNAYLAKLDIEKWPTWQPFTTERQEQLKEELIAGANKILAASKANIDAAFPTEVADQIYQKGFDTMISEYSELPAVPHKLKEDAKQADVLARLIEAQHLDKAHRELLDRAPHLKLDTPLADKPGDSASETEVSAEEERLIVG